MRKLFIISCCVLLFAGCTEKGPFINFSDANYTDTSYVLPSVPATDPHNVLAEEFTGQSCPNCPAAHDLLTSLAAGGRLNTLGYYVFNVPQANPPTGAAYDFRDSIAFRIGNSIYGGAPGGGIPCGGIDRVRVGGALSLYSSQWTDAYNSRLGVVDSVNISVSSTFNPLNDSVKITTTVTYLQTVPTQQYLSIAIVEDSITDFQETTHGVDSTYLFTNIFRDMVSTQSGDLLLQTIAVKPAGQVDKRVYSYLANPAWNAKRCRVIVFVTHNGAAGGDVMQSVQTKLAP